MTMAQVETKKESVEVSVFHSYKLTALVVNSKVLFNSIRQPKVTFLMLFSISDYKIE